MAKLSKQGQNSLAFSNIDDCMLNNASTFVNPKANCMSSEKSLFEAK